MAREFRQSQTNAETILWRALRNRNLKYKFRRQYPIDRFIVDFYCPQVRLCIEVDGGTHYEAGQAHLDAARTSFLEHLGYKLIHFRNDDGKPQCC
jgi:very-short-patch-repair endonuclease